ncbi:MAG TPA: lytic transglycosylase domain-containing protein, partial [Candidatus Binataceae bacterium]|nr:lytic transglycosylase domain-containing protein [Candidatus Binataceae bacterium]
LLDSRYRLVQALAHPPAASEPDPVRSLFLEFWRRLGASVRSAARRGKLGARSLEFLSFISAGDALFALDQAAPALGMRISAADLRRLAHIMAPRAKGDPLEFNFNEDAELKRLFKPTEPLANPTALEAAPAESPAPGAAPASSLPPSPHERAHPGASGTDSFDAPLKNVAARLWLALASRDNADSYRADMSRLLELSANRESNQSQLDGRYQPMFRTLVESAAWQESCWRQFIRADGRIRWLESSTGDIGLMQVNKHVWRGFYSLERLRWDVLYNAGAGCEILMQMTEYVIARPAFDPVPVAGNLARSAYAAYNGGPSAYNRWRVRQTRQPVDDEFAEKYRTVERGDPVDILVCADHWRHVTRR